MSFDSITHAKPHLALAEYPAASQIYEHFKGTLSAGQNPSVKVVKATFPELCQPDEGSHQRVSRWVGALWPTTRVAGSNRGRGSGEAKKKRKREESANKGGIRFDPAMATPDELLARMAGFAKGDHVGCQHSVAQQGAEEVQVEEEEEEVCYPQLRIMWSSNSACCPCPFYFQREVEVQEPYGFDVPVQPACASCSGRGCARPVGPPPQTTSASLSSWAMLSWLGTTTVAGHRAASWR